MNNIKTFATAATLLAAASSVSAEVVSITGTLNGTTNSLATVSYTPATPTIAGTFDTVTGAINWSVQDYVMTIAIVPAVMEAYLDLSGNTMIGDGSAVTGGGSTVNSCTGIGGADGLICPSVGVPPGSNTYSWTWDGTNGTLSQNVDDANYTEYSFSEAVTLPPLDVNSNPPAIPAMSVYSLGLTVLGLSLVAIRRLRKSHNQK